MKKLLLLACTFLTSNVLLAMAPTPIVPGGGENIGLMKRCMGWCPFGGRMCMMRIIVIALLIVIIILSVALLRKKK
jgi:hypothetical protein